MFFVSTVLLALTSCATVATVASNEEQVTLRAQDWLDALRQRDFDRALEYTTPAFRSVTSKSGYSGRYAGAATWTDGKIDKVVCDGDRCVVRFLVSYRLGRPRIENTRPLEKVWIQQEGQWYIYER